MDLKNNAAALWRNVSDFQFLLDRKKQKTESIKQRETSPTCGARKKNIEKKIHLWSELGSQRP